jgi:hypothetical protein
MGAACVRVWLRMISECSHTQNQRESALVFISLERKRNTDRLLNAQQCFSNIKLAFALRTLKAILI